MNECNIVAGSGGKGGVRGDITELARARPVAATIWR